MIDDRQPRSVEQMLDWIAEEAAGREVISLGDILKAIGRRSFGALLLLAGLIILAPLIGDIPGVPALNGALVLFSAVQLLIGREYVWFPQWLERRSISTSKVCKAIGWLHRPARLIDRISRERLAGLTQGPAIRVIATVCAIIALGIPVMELVPFSANGAGAALATFGLSLIARDGLLALIAFMVTIATLGLIALGVS